MILSLEKNFLFIHVPKTGGVSVSKALKRFQYRSTRNFGFYAVQKRSGIRLIRESALHLESLASPPPHVRIAEIEKEFASEKISRALVRNGYLTSESLSAASGAALFTSLYKFAFVRNPWAQIFSAYNYVKAKPNHPRHSDYTSRFKNFEQFVEWIAEKPKERDKPQTHFLNDENGRSIVDFVGKFERLDEDFQYVMTQLNLGGIKLKHKNKSPKMDYRKMYTDVLVDKVAEIRKSDIEAFGYSFSN